MLPVAFYDYTKCEQSSIGSANFIFPHATVRLPLGTNMLRPARGLPLGGATCGVALRQGGLPCTASGRRSVHGAFGSTRVASPVKRCNRGGGARRDRGAAPGNSADGPHVFRSTSDDPLVKEDQIPKDFISLVGLPCTGARNGSSTTCYLCTAPLHQRGRYGTTTGVPAPSMVGRPGGTQ